MSATAPGREAVESTPDGGTMVEPARGLDLPSLRELWQHRELLYFLGWRDIKVRYKQTLIGAGWAILQPLMTMVIFSIVFGGLLAVPSDGVPYPVFSYAALVPWTFFAAAVTRAGGSLVYDANLISKVYFPRLLVPLAALSAPALDLGVASVILAGMLVAYGVVPGANLLALPLFLGLAVATATALGIWLSALNVKYRDVGYVIPFLLQAWLFATPVAYPSSIVPEAWRTLYGLNPMVGVIEGIRWALLGTGPLPIMMIVASAIAVFVLLVTGILYFQHVEAELADVV